MPAFARRINIEYPGPHTPTATLKGLRECIMNDQFAPLRAELLEQDAVSLVGQTTQ